MKPMSDREYRAALDHWSVTQGTLAEALQISIRSSNSYANGAPIPFHVAVLIRLMRRYDLNPADLEKL